MINPPTLDAAILSLSDRDEFKVIVAHIRDERENAIAMLKDATGGVEAVFRVVGQVIALDDLLTVLET